MYYRSEVISYLQANRILALKLDHALMGVGRTVSEQIKLTGAGPLNARCITHPALQMNIRTYVSGRKMKIQIQARCFSSY
nr:Uncharacterised protein [Raoultella sp. NCTC 9187]